MTAEKIERINELARTAKERELTDEEKVEREALRNEYRASVIGNMRAELNNTYIIDAKGNKIKLKK